MASEREPLAWGLGLTVGPGWELDAGGGAWGGALVVAEGADDGDDDGDVAACAGAEEVVGVRVGYWRAAEPATRAALDPDEPILCVIVGLCLRREDESRRLKKFTSL